MHILVLLTVALFHVTLFSSASGTRDKSSRSPEVFFSHTKNCEFSDELGGLLCRQRCRFVESDEDAAFVYLKQHLEQACRKAGHGGRYFLHYIADCPSKDEPNMLEYEMVWVTHDTSPKTLQKFYSSRLLRSFCIYKQF